MTARSIPNIARVAVSMLAEIAPHIRVKSIKGARVGSTRLARVTLEDGRYFQTTIATLGTHAASAAQGLADAIAQAFPPAKARPAQFSGEPKA
jgi:hypothetical protein